MLITYGDILFSKKIKVQELEKVLQEENLIKIYDSTLHTLFIEKDPVSQLARNKVFVEYYKKIQGGRSEGSPGLSIYFLLPRRFPDFQYEGDIHCNQWFLDRADIVYKKLKDLYSEIIVGSKRLDLEKYSWIINERKFERKITKWW